MGNIHSVQKALQLYGAKTLVTNLANDIVSHFEKRQAVFDGKAMIVTMSRRIAADLFNEIIALRPGWKNDDLSKGTIKVVFEYTELDKVKRGDILVTPMTTPNFLPAMNKASAFITDEGGVMCHAAIVAREMNKPCIVGTKVATQSLKDGDLVEVDANKGIIKIIKRA